MMMWLYASAALMVVTALVHSLGGEKRLLIPLLSNRSGILAHSQSRKVLRGAWHLTSLFMVLTAAVMAWPDTAPGLKTVMAAVWLVVGLCALASSKGRHIGWPTLIAAGVTGLMGSLA